MSVIGAAKLKDSAAMKRGRTLEPWWRNRELRPDPHTRPLICDSSSDGLLDDGKAVVEVKCPAHERRVRQYIKENSTMA